MIRRVTTSTTRCDQQDSSDGSPGFQPDTQKESACVEECAVWCNDRLHLGHRQRAACRRLYTMCQIVRLGAWTTCTIVLAIALVVAPRTPRVVVDKTTTEAITTTEVVKQGSTTTTILKPAPLRVLCFLGSTDDSLGALADGGVLKNGGSNSRGLQTIERNRSALARIKDVRSLRTYLLVRELVISAKVGRLLDIALTDHSRTGRPGRSDWPGDGRSHRSRHGNRSALARINGVHSLRTYLLVPELVISANVGRLLDIAVTDHSRTDRPGRSDWPGDGNRSALARIDGVHSLRTYFLVRELVISANVGRLLDIALTDHSRTGRPGRSDWPGDGNRSALACINGVHSLRTYLLVRELVISANVGRLLDIAVTDHSRTGRPGRSDWPGDGRSHRSRHGRRGPRGGGGNSGRGRRVVRLGARLAPLSLPSLWLSPSGHGEPICLSEIQCFLNQCPAAGCGLRGPANRKIWAGSHYRRVSSADFPFWSWNKLSTTKLEQVWTRNSLSTCVLYALFGPLISYLRRSWVVRLGARRACTTALAIALAVAVRTPRAGLCDLVQGELAPLPLPSLGLLPLGHHEPPCSRQSRGSRFYNVPSPSLFSRVVRLGARRACTTALAITLVVAVRTPRAGLCSLVHAQIAPLSLPSLWLPPSGYNEPGCVAWCTDSLRHGPCHRSGCHRRTPRAGIFGLARIIDVHPMLTFFPGPEIGYLRQRCTTTKPRSACLRGGEDIQPRRGCENDDEPAARPLGKDAPVTGLCGLVHGQIAPLSLPSLWLSPSGHHEPEDLGWPALSTCILCGLAFLVRKLVIYVKGGSRRAPPCATNARSPSVRKIWAGPHYRSASSEDFPFWSGNWLSASRVTHRIPDDGGTGESGSPGSPSTWHQRPGHRNLKKVPGDDKVTVEEEAERETEPSMP
ncbi:uncharacterized protein LOC142592671 [Dermacentor variabilis]|uniref:uncharacterized protein LOC142592671 n=1 Tax=Dermacentor variabilis TaxID=34621 RepID=UPI003F5ADFF6